MAKKLPISNINHLLIKGIMRECNGNESVPVTGPDCSGLVFIASIVPHTIQKGEVHLVVDAAKNVVLVGEYIGIGWGGATKVSYKNAYVIGARKSHPIWAFANRECYHVRHPQYLREWYATKPESAMSCIWLGGRMVLVIDGCETRVTREEYNEIVASGTVRFKSSYDNGRAFGTTYTKMELSSFKCGDVRTATRDMTSDNYFAVGS